MHVSFALGPTMEAQVQEANPSDQPAVDGSSPARFKWLIRNFSKITANNVFSDVFSQGSHKWRILVFPYGNNVDHFSVYLCVADSKTLPSGWSKYAKMSCSVINQLHSENTVKKDTEHRFNECEQDWGFSSIVPLDELRDASRGFVVRDTCIVEVEVSVKLKEKHDEKNRYKIIKVSRDSDLMKQIGRDIYFDLVDHDKVRTFCIPKEMCFNQFKERVAKEFGIPVLFQRFWLWAKRKNQTYRPLRPLTLSEQACPVDLIRENRTVNSRELKLFLEVGLGLHLPPARLPNKTREEILLFFKLYDPLMETLRYVGKLLVKRSGKPAEILTMLKEMAAYISHKEIELYEEIRFDPIVMCERLDNEATFVASEIEDGDIICFQKSLAGNAERCLYRYPDVPSFLERIRKKQGNLVQPKQEPKSSDAQANITDKSQPAVLKLAQKNSNPVASISTAIAEQSKQVPLVSGHFALVKVPGTLSREASQQIEKATPTATTPLVVGQLSVQPPGELSIILAKELDSSSFAEIDRLFSDVQNLLEGQQSEADTLISTFSRRCSAEEIANAKEFLKQCLHMELSGVVQSEQRTELKNSLSTMIASNAFPSDVVDGAAKFLTNFDRYFEQYAAAQKDVRATEEKEKSIGELKIVMKQLSADFTPKRKEAEAVDREIAELETQLTEREAKKARLRKSLKELAGEATTMKLSLVSAKEDMKMLTVKKEEAEKTVSHLERSWESLKVGCSQLLQ